MQRARRVAPKYREIAPISPIETVLYAETLPRFSTREAAGEWLSAVRRSWREAYDGVPIFAEIRFGVLCYVAEKPGDEGSIVVLFEGPLFCMNLPWGIA